MGWVILFLVGLIIAIGCTFNLHCFNSYTCNIDEAYREYKQWKKLYEESTQYKIELIDVKNHGYYVAFYYKIKK